MRFGGYIRRKVTYNIGKGGKRTAPSDNPTLYTNEGETKEKAIIVDQYGQTEVSWDWIRLIPDGYEHIDLAEVNGIYYHYYRIRAGPSP